MVFFCWNMLLFKGLEIMSKFVLDLNWFLKNYVLNGFFLIVNFRSLSFIGIKFLFNFDLIELL